MDFEIIKNASVSGEDAYTGELEAESNNRDSLEVLSSRGDMMRELESAGEVLTKVELELACFSEKLLNLDILVMHVASRESDFEAFASEEEKTFGDSAKKALEFDFLSGFLESELKELDYFELTLQVEIDNARETISSHKNWSEAFDGMQENLLDCEKSLKQSLEQVSEIKAQSDNFQRIIFKSSGVKQHNDMEGPENGYSSDLGSKIKMQTAEQQRHILRMFEKSLAREIDLEKKLTDLRQNEEILKLRLQQEVFCMEEEVEAALEKLFEAESCSEVLLGMSRELMSQNQILKFNLNGFVQREGEMRSKCEELSEQLSTKDLALQKSDSTNAELKIHELENLISNLKKQVSDAEKRAEIAEAENKLLIDTNAELTKVKSNNISTLERVNLLERQLRESDIKLQHAVASAEASEEKQTMLCSTIEDMENLIKALKLKVSKAESRFDGAEEKCIILSETNEDLNEELNFLRSRIESLEASLHKAEEEKRATAEDIGIRTKLIKDLILQLALERERLHKQISLLTMEKKILSKCLQQVTKDHSSTQSKEGEEIVKGFAVSTDEFASAASCKEMKTEATEILATSHELDKSDEEVLLANAEVRPAEPSSKLETVRNIDAKQLHFKYVLVAVFVLMISGLVAVFFQHPSYQC